MIGEFLKTRRRQLVRADFGLPPVARGSSGLRREEVAYLARVSITWYTRLEQGRDVTPSRQVLDALAQTLRLSSAEHAYLLSLAGYAAPQPAADPVSQTAPAPLQRLLDALTGYPAYAIAPDWAITAWNTAYAALYPNVATVVVVELRMPWRSISATSPAKSAWGERCGAPVRPPCACGRPPRWASHAASCPRATCRRTSTASSSSG